MLFHRHRYKVRRIRNKPNYLRPGSTGNHNPIKGIHWDTPGDYPTSPKNGPKWVYFKNTKTRYR